jgi:hypothetical protein
LILLFLYIFELLPVVLYASFLRRNRHEGLQVIFIYCLVSFGTEILTPLLKKAFDINVFYSLATFTVVEYFLLTIFLYQSIPDRRLKYVPVIGSLVFFPVAIINFLQGRITSFDSTAASVEAILIIIYSLLFLYSQIKDPAILFVYNTKKFWVVSAFFIYFSSTLFLFLYSPYLTKQQRANYWYINNLFDIIKNILFCIAFTMKTSNKSENPIENNYEDSYEDRSLT